MNRAQIVIIALLATVVLGVFAVLGYLILSDRQSGAERVAPPAATEVSAPAGSIAPGATATRRPAPSPTPSRRPAATAANAEQAQKLAQATLAAGANATAEADNKIRAILVQMPAGDINLSAENAQLKLTIVRMTWLGPGSLAIKLKATNVGTEKISFNLQSLILEDVQRGQNPQDIATSKTLPGPFAATELAAGASAEGQIAFKLPLRTAPAGLNYNDGKIEALKIDIMAWIMKQPRPSATPTK
jgi:hypothetical protein